MSRKRNRTVLDRRMRFHLRLTNPDRQKLSADITVVGSGRATVLVAGFEHFDRHTRSEIALHGHALIETTECEDTVRKRVKKQGYSTGCDYYLKANDDNEDTFNYMCKGNRHGDYDVEFLSAEKASFYHERWWETADRIEQRKDKSSDRTPIYFQIADYVQSNKHEFSRYVYELADGRLVDADSYDSGLDGPYETEKYILDQRKTIGHIIDRYSANGPLFDHETIKKVLWMIVGRLDREAAIEKANKLVGEFNCAI